MEYSRLSAQGRADLAARQCGKDMSKCFARARDKALGRPVVARIQGLCLVGLVWQERTRLPRDPVEERLEEDGVVPINQWWCK